MYYDIPCLRSRCCLLLVYIPCVLCCVSDVLACKYVCRMFVWFPLSVNVHMRMLLCWLFAVLLCLNISVMLSVAVL